MISPLSADSELYIDRLHEETVNSVKVADIAANEYTKIHGAVAGIEFHIDTENEFIVAYSYNKKDK